MLQVMDGGDVGEAEAVRLQPTDAGRRLQPCLGCGAQRRRQHPDPGTSNDGHFAHPGSEARVRSAVALLTSRGILAQLEHHCKSFRATFRHQVEHDHQFLLEEVAVDLGVVAGVVCQGREDWHDLAKVHLSGEIGVAICE